MNRVIPMEIKAYKLEIKIWGVRWDKVEFIISNLFPWDVDKNRNRLNRHPKNRVNIIKGNLRYLHCAIILIIFISEKNDNRGGTEKFPHKIIIRNIVKIGVQFMSTDLK